MEPSSAPARTKLLAWLENNGFFEAPASAGHHGNHPGGLAVHSVNVWRRLREITVRDALKGGSGRPVAGGGGNRGGHGPVT